nr:PREDICTED: uncharacterized protein C5orf49 homolog isoform X1 [Rhinolophus sinicus]
MDGPFFLCCELQVGGGHMGGDYQRKRKDSWLHHHQVSSWGHIGQKGNAELSDSEHTSIRKQTQAQREELSDFSSQTGIISLYDCVFKKNPGYNQKLHRDDREHAKSLGLYVNEEEQERPVGVLTSSVYGRRIHQPLEPLNRDYSRANNLKTDFYRKNDIPSFKAPGFGHISPA